MKIISNCVLPLSMALLFGACAQEETLPLDSTQNDSVESNGMQLNGMQLNGTQSNGMQLNGMQLNGMQLNGMQLNGMQLNGTQLSAYKNGDPAQIVSGPALVGTILTINYSGYLLYVKINAMYPDTVSTSGDVYLYDATYQWAGTSTWTSLCRDADGNALPGIPIANYWNMTTGARVNAPTALTFACVNGAIGKCVRWGYRPWATGTVCNGGNCNSVPLTEYHQACTRMVRADYCGTGKSNTVDGTQIDVYDGLTPQIQSPSTNWLVEAKWNANGATCIGNTRGADLSSKFKYPDCNGDKKYTDFPPCVENDYSVTGANLLGDNYLSTQNTKTSGGGS